MSYDSKCLCPAEDFLDDVPGLSPGQRKTLKHTLAQVIQDAIEDFLIFEPEIAKAEGRAE
ncbi:MAG: hypothetical protein ACREC4_00850 [Methylocella sp.]